MRASAAVRAEADDEGRTRLTVLRSATPLVLRPTADALYVAAGAAGPVGGDELDLSVTVAAGARLCVRTVAAAVVLPGDGVSTFTWRLDVAAGARLCILPEPTVVVNGARHHTRVVAAVTAAGSLTVREETQLGRHGETGGTHVTSLRVDAGGAPLLRHELTSAGTDPVSTGASSAIGARAYGSLLAVDPSWTDERRARLARAEPDLAVMPLAGPGVLVTTLAADVRQVRDRIACSLPVV